MAEWYRENAAYQLPEAPLTAEEKARGAQRDAQRADDAGRPQDADDQLDPRNEREARERYDPETYRDMIEQRDQMKRDDKNLERKTFGLLADADGEPLWEQTQHSGEREETKQMWADLGLPPRVSARSHLEAHVAAYMRENDVNEAYLYLDRPVCPYDRARDDDWREWPTCDMYLPKALKPDARLAVFHQQPGDESNGWAERLWCKTYVGEQETSE